MISLMVRARLREVRSGRVRAQTARSDELRRDSFIKVEARISLQGKLAAQPRSLLAVAEDKDGSKSVFLHERKQKERAYCNRKVPSGCVDHVAFDMHVAVPKGGGSRSLCIDPYTAILPQINKPLPLDKWGRDVGAVAVGTAT